jgi:hypothetical protein
MRKLIAICLLAASLALPATAQWRNARGRVGQSGGYVLRGFSVVVGVLPNWIIWRYILGPNTYICSDANPDRPEWCGR